jgi:hypothetical protein
MDSSGARLLVERFRSAVTVGRVIIVDRDTPELDLRVGDTGTVRAITDQGWLVAWEKGPTLLIDPTEIAARVMS